MQHTLMCIQRALINSSNNIRLYIRKWLNCNISLSLYTHTCTHTHTCTGDPTANIKLVFSMVKTDNYQRLPVMWTLKCLIAVSILLYSIVNIVDVMQFGGYLFWGSHTQVRLNCTCWIILCWARGGLTDNCICVNIKLVDCSIRVVKHILQ